MSNVLGPTTDRRLLSEVAHNVALYCVTIRRSTTTVDRNRIHGGLIEMGAAESILHLLDGSCEACPITTDMHPFDMMAEEMRMIYCCLKRHLADYQKQRRVHIIKYEYKLNKRCNEWWEDCIEYPEISEIFRHRQQTNYFEQGFVPTAQFLDRTRAYIDRLMDNDL
ncbi:hypothetical protein HHI36_016809 [Cryptolaemus montrouzieri]|uniref:Uncharacterized protein n=1 Tax=Cryptolaemus montrouzieri TaxID=559131 RepID=A0ABD2NKM5_9CUCU